VQRAGGGQWREQFDFSIMRGHRVVCCIVVVLYLFAVRPRNQVQLLLMNLHATFSSETVTLFSTAYRA